MSGRITGMNEYTNKMVNVVRHLVVMSCLALIANTSVGANQRLPKMLTMYQQLCMLYLLLLIIE